MFREQHTISFTFMENERTFMGAFVQTKLICWPVVDLYVLVSQLCLCDGTLSTECDTFFMINGYSFGRIVCLPTRNFHTESVNLSVSFFFVSSLFPISPTQLFISPHHTACDCVTFQLLASEKLFTFITVVFVGCFMLTAQWLCISSHLNNRIAQI